MRYPLKIQAPTYTDSTSEVHREFCKDLMALSAVNLPITSKQHKAYHIPEAREHFMERIQARFVGVELYFENLERAKKFYLETMGLEVSDEQVGHHAKFNSGR